MFRTSRIALPAVLLAVCAVLSASSAVAQSAGSKRVTDHVLTTKDNFPIAITYYESADGKESPVVIAVHGERGNRLIWKKFAERLQNEGIAVVTVDLRHHGESKQGANVGLPARARRRRGNESRLTPDDYKAMVMLDLKAVKKFLYEQHQAQKLNMRKTAIVAADFSVPIAVNFALIDWTARPYNDAPTLAASTPRGQDVRAMVFLSPEERVPGLVTGREIVALRNPAWNVAFLVVNGKRDGKDRGTATEMYEKLSGLRNSEQRMYHKEYDTAFRGTDLLGRGRSVPVEEHMLQFFKLHLKGLPDKWEDREPRI